MQYSLIERAAIRLGDWFDRLGYKCRSWAYRRERDRERAARDARFWPQEKLQPGETVGAGDEIGMVYTNGVMEPVIRRARAPADGPAMWFLGAKISGQPQRLPTPPSGQS